MKSDEFLMAAMMGRTNEVRTGIKAGVNLDAKSDTGLNALHYAALYGHLEIIELLLKSGASVDAVSDVDETGSGDCCSALGYAVSSAFLQDKSPVIKVLVENGADVNSRDIAGKTPLIRFIQTGGDIVIAQLLLEHGADVSATDNNNNSVLVHAIEQGHRAIIDLLESHSSSKQGLLEYHLINAARENSMQQMKDFIESGANVNHRFGSTALCAAAEAGHDEAVQLLIEAGAELNQREDETGFTPLIAAAYHGHLMCVRLLINAGADLAIEVEDMGTALSYARLGKEEGLYPNQPWDEIITLLC